MFELEVFSNAGLKLRQAFFADDLFETVEQSKALFTLYELRKNKNNLMIPRVNAEIARGSFYYSGAKLYNNLPNKIKTSLSMSALKKFYFK